jgi:CRISPR-associated protein Csb2
VIFKLNDTNGKNVSFDPKSSCHVASWVRSKACEVSRDYDWPGGSEVFVAGHAKGNETAPRLAYIPIPSIGHRYADNRIRRVMIAAFGGSGLREYANMIGGLLVGEPVTDVDKNVMAVLARCEPDGVTSQYLGKSDRWLSVTPMVLPGYCNGRLSKAVSLISKSLDRAGLSNLVEKCEISRSPFFGPLPRCWDSKARYKNKPFVFVKLRFRKPVSGPVCLGSARYAGLGVFARD